jgi:hypothetical protein
MKKLQKTKKRSLIVITSIAISLSAWVPYSVAQGYGPGEGPSSPENPPQAAAPSIELNSAAMLRAQTILKGKPIIFRNGKFELSN